MKVIRAVARRARRASASCKSFIVPERWWRPTNAKCSAQTQDPSWPFAVPFARSEAHRGRHSWLCARFPQRIRRPSWEVLSGRGAEPTSLPLKRGCSGTSWSIGVPLLVSIQLTLTNLPSSSFHRPSRAATCFSSVARPLLNHNRLPHVPPTTP